MTTNEAIYQLWENAGEPSDLDPWMDNANQIVNGFGPYDPDTQLDPNSLGVKHFLRLLTDAQIMLANWKTNGLRPIRFKSQQVQRNVKLTLDDPEMTCRTTNVSDYISVVSTDIDPLAVNFNQAGLVWLTDSTVESAKCELTVSYFNTQTEATNQAEYDAWIAGGSIGPAPVLVYPLVEVVYENMVMFPELIDNGTDQTLNIYFQEELTMPNYVDGSGNTIYFSLESSIAKFYFDRFKIMRTGSVRDSAYFALPTSFRNILKITDATSSSPLSRAASKENLFNPDLNSGAPTQWYALGDVIYFDTYFDDPRWFVVEYQKLPERLMVMNGTIPPLEIPTQWHDVLLEIVEYDLAKRAQENELVATKFANINRLISHMRPDQEEENLRDEVGGFKLRRS